MFQRKIQLNESDLLIIFWQKGWSNLSIKFNNVEVGTFPDKESLELGKWMYLPNGKPILVRLMKKELEIWDGNNELFSGLKSGESDHYAAAWKALISYGALFLILSVTTIRINDSKIGSGMSFVFSILGLVYIALALWARKKQDKLPLKIALGLQGLICLLTLLSGGVLPCAILGVLAYYLFKGTSARLIANSKTEYFPDANLLDEGI